MHQTLDEEKQADEKLTEIAEWNVNQAAAQEAGEEEENEEDEEEEKVETEEELILYARFLLKVKTWKQIKLTR